MFFRMWFMHNLASLNTFPQNLSITYLTNMCSGQLTVWRQVVIMANNVWITGCGWCSGMSRWSRHLCETACGKEETIGLCWSLSWRKDFDWREGCVWLRAGRHGMWNTGGSKNRKWVCWRDRIVGIKASPSSISPLWWFWKEFVCACVCVCV